MDIISAIFNGNEQVRYLGYLILANLVLGVVASLKSGDFRLTAVADWLTQRLVPLAVGYGAASLIVLGNADLGYIRDAAFYALTAALVGYVLANLKDFGVPIPDALAGKRDE